MICTLYTCTSVCYTADCVCVVACCLLYRHMYTLCVSDVYICQLSRQQATTPEQSVFVYCWYISLSEIFYIYKYTVFINPNITSTTHILLHIYYI